MFPQAPRSFHQAHNPRLGGAWLLLGTFLYVCQDLLFKDVPSVYPTLQVIFLRCLFALIPTLLLSIPEASLNGGWAVLWKTEHLKGHVFRALIMAASLWAYVIGCRVLPLPEVYSLSYTSPLFILLLTAFLDRMPLTKTQVFSVVLGFAGVLLVIQPGQALFQTEILAPLVSGLFTALAILWGRRLAFQDSNVLITTMYLGACLIPLLPVMPFLWEPPTREVWLTFLMIGFLGGIAQWCFIHAFRCAPAAEIASLDYLGLVWAVVLSYLFFHEWPTVWTMVGSVLIVGAGLAQYMPRYLKSRFS
jgi:drug/metabolite transporter (DMT)-like permease